MNYRIVETPPPCADGYIEVTDAPGLGLGQYVPEAIAEMEELANRDG